MKLKLSLEHAGTTADVMVTVEGGTAVGALAEHLDIVHPKGGLRGDSGGRLTLAVMSPARIVIDPAVSVAESGLHSGSVVSLTRDGIRYSAAKAAAAVAHLRVVSGPDAGKEFPLVRGTSIIGREASCEVRLTDSLVSRQHARINVTDTVEVIDLGSSNGVVVGGDVVARVAVRVGDVVQVGDTAFTVSAPFAPGATEAVGHDGASLPFNRSPRLDPDYSPTELTAPEPPEPAKPRRFPLITLLAPLVMGGVLFLVTHSVFSLMFIGLTPIMLLATTGEARMVGKREFNAAVAAFREELVTLVATATTAAELERNGRLAEHPSTSECVASARDLSNLLWTRRPGHERFVDVRLGLGPVRARNVIILPRSPRTTRALTSELSDTVARFAVAVDVPVVARLRDGALGVAGERLSALPVARSYVAQIAALHSPAELVIAAFVSSSTGGDWEWLKWLPHTSSPHSPIDVRHLASTAGAAAALLATLEDVVDRRGSDDTCDALPAVVVLVENDSPADRSRLVALATEGRAAGVHVVWLASHTTHIPAACTTFVEVRAQSSAGDVGFVDTAEAVGPTTLETLTAAEALQFARCLSPLVDSGVPVDDDSDLPRSVSFLAITRRELATDPAALIERWCESGSLLTGPYSGPVDGRRVGSLRCVVGQTAGEPLALDLRSHGPHALVGGTTGSGKSELLQSWILGMATTHSPQRVTFLLVDYKGGSAFAECVDLPHTVGLVTDLSPYLVRRALTSLSAELRYREHLLASKKAKDLVSVERNGDPEAPPSLVIVVDEFAALVKEVPEFVDGVVNVAQRGRSLGLHLILATQRPAGVIKDNLRANTNLRLALRMADGDDSQDVLGSPVAATFDPDIPGRAVAKLGPGRLTPFQAAYSGGWTTDDPRLPEIVVDELLIGSNARWEPRVPIAARARDEGPTDIVRLVATVCDASAVAAVPTPRRPWLDELAASYELALLPMTRRDDEIVFAVTDDPERQAQPPAAFAPDVDGNLVVFGSGGAGKSTLLRSIAIAAGLTVRGGPCHVYGLDFGGRGLQPLEGLPHVGSIILGSDEERVRRLLSWLRQTVVERAGRYAAVRAGSITDYRKFATSSDEPRIIVLLDGIGAMRQAFENSDRVIFDQLTAVATEGRPVGVHLVVGAERWSALPTMLAPTLQRRVVLRMTTDDDYAMLGVPADVLTSASPPGRGVIDGFEMQVAVLGGSQSMVDQSVAISQLAVSMKKAGGKPAPTIRCLPDVVSMADLPDTLDGRPVIGLSSVTLAPLSFEPSGSFLISGPPRSGTSTALVALAESLRRWKGDVRLLYVGSHRSPAAAAGLWSDAAVSAIEAHQLATRLLADMLEEGGSPLTALFIEGVADYVGGLADAALQDLAKHVLSEGHLLVVAGEASTLTDSYTPLMKAAKSGRQGLALHPDTNDGPSLFKTSFPRISATGMPQGRGLWVSRGHAELVQVALPKALDD
ncbi:MAG: domain containing protein [Frankiales bacterium]|nr:domain containing protein [Frankiales bacterium]